MSASELPTESGFEHVPEPKAGHSADHEPHGPHEEPCGFLIVRHNGTMMGWYETRHEAIGDATKRISGLFDETRGLADDYTLVHTHPDAVPFEDLRWGDSE